MPSQFGDTIDAELRAGLVDLWPLLASRRIMLGVTGVFRFEECTEADVDAMVADLGPLTLDVQWECPLRGLPHGKLCGVQLCLNGAWKWQYSEPQPGAFCVYVSIGTRNHHVEDEWVRASGLRLGEPLGGW
ncbi:hypothetical protein [Streptomyces sp. RPT161]|uniref:hypothetical protein n=1 Tax=Streptomyces sp. RPT161 TaxID=3015993 RepID=UPI0022B8A1E5|nr:hypothetical protein [Streptomyces sp. RPT161]